MTSAFTIIPCGHSLRSGQDHVPVGPGALGGELHRGPVARIVDDLGQPEIRDLYVALLVEQDIARLEVVVDDPLCTHGTHGDGLSKQMGELARELTTLPD